MNTALAICLSLLVSRAHKMSKRSPKPLRYPTANVSLSDSHRERFPHGQNNVQ